MKTLPRAAWRRIAVLAAFSILPSGLLAAPVTAAPAKNASLSQAANVVYQLQYYRDGVSLLADLTPSTDPERLVGLPGQYLSRAVFTDARASNGEINGIVEVFEYPVDLRRRRSTMKRFPDEIDVVSGTILLRLLGVSTDYAEYYRIALNDYIVLY